MKPPDKTPTDAPPKGPRAHVDIPAPDDPEALGQEGVESNIKRNTTDAGERKDRS
jgi:hypothetical protein